MRLTRVLSVHATTIARLLERVISNHPTVHRQLCGDCEQGIGSLVASPGEGGSGVRARAMWIKIVVRVYSTHRDGSHMSSDQPLKQAGKLIGKNLGDVGQLSHTGCTVNVCARTTQGRAIASGLHDDDSAQV